MKQLMYAVVAALLCFVGPTYFVALLSEVIPQVYSMAIGFLTFLLGIFLIYRLVKE